MKTYLIVTATPNPQNQVDVQKYSEEVFPMLVQAGGKSPVRAKLQSVIKGEVSGPLFLFMEFPDVQSINTLFESEAYQRLLPYRERAFSELNILTFSDL